MMSSTVASSGMLMVFEIAPERNGCAAAIIFTWPVQRMERPPPWGASEQSKTAKCSSFTYRAPSSLKEEQLAVFDCSLAPQGGGRAIKNRQMLFLHVSRPFDFAVFVDVGNDFA